MVPRLIKILKRNAHESIRIHSQIKHNRDVYFGFDYLYSFYAFNGFLFTHGFPYFSTYSKHLPVYFLVFFI